MIRQTEVLTSSDGHVVQEIETIRPLNNKELEERLYELTEIVKSCVIHNPHILGTDLLANLVERLDKLQKDFS